MDTSRLKLLIGADKAALLAGKKIALFGLGGVGSYALEALARCGVGSFVLIDGDRIEPSNLNRQLLALHSTLGRRKVDAAHERLLDINPGVQVQCHALFYLPENAVQVDLSGCDYILDAVDTVTAKLHIIQSAHALGIPCISAMGAGNKLLPHFEVADIYDTSVCPLCRVMRKELRARDIPSLKVVYSRETGLSPAPQRARDSEGTTAPRTGVHPASNEMAPRQKSPVGSISFVPAACGLTMASEVIRDLAAL